jgi:hypothetical protein
MTVTTAETKEVANVLPAHLADFDMNQASGDGFEDADKDSFAVPFLRILQSTSPQCVRGKVSFLPDAQPGMFFNTITEDLYDQNISVIPVHYTREFIEWFPNRGGFVMSHGPDEAILKRVIRVDDKKNQILDNGNVIQDTRNHYVLLADDLEKGLVIFSLTSTGIKHSKKWMTLMNGLMLPKTKKRAPMYTAKWELESVFNENDDGSWYQIGDKSKTCVKYNSWVNNKEWQHALAAREIIKSGEAKADWDSTIDPEQQQTEQRQYTDHSDRGTIPF